MSPEDRKLGQEVLATPMDRNDASANSVHEYLVALLATVWEQGSDFSGKRPFGNSGWEGELEKALLIHGLVEGAFDSHHDIEWIDDQRANKLIALAIQALLPEGE